MTSALRHNGSIAMRNTDVPAARRELDGLIDRLYTKLKPLAARVRWSGANPSLSPTVLLHEAYLKLLNAKGLAEKPDHEVIGIFVHVMRQIMVDAARRRKSLKRGGAVERTPLAFEDGTALEPPAPEAPLSPEDVLTLEAAMVQLERDSPRAATVIGCRFYLGLTVAETARALGVATATVEREDRDARKFLNAKIRPTR